MVVVGGNMEHDPSASGATSNATVITFNSNSVGAAAAQAVITVTMAKMTAVTAVATISEVHALSLVLGGTLCTLA